MYLLGHGAPFAEKYKVNQISRAQAQTLYYGHGLGTVGLFSSPAQNQQDCVVSAHVGLFFQEITKHFISQVFTL